MQYALVNNFRIEAEKGMKGICLCCNQPVIAKCGNQKINHWAHKSLTQCDSWWERETEWHRNWKNQFPPEFHECVMTDESTGEKHIADVFTSHKLTLEFQHSAIKPEELISREQFYKNMLWVVDGARLKSDFTRFIKNNDLFYSCGNPSFLCTKRADLIFNKAWINSSCVVIFDFDNAVIEDEEHSRWSEILWALIPGEVEGYRIVIGLQRADIVSRLLQYPHIFSVEEIIQAFKNYKHMAETRRNIVYHPRTYRRGRRL